MGLVINRPARDLRFLELAEQIDLPTPEGHVSGGDMPIHAGGPVEPGRGFVLHSRDYITNDSTLTVSDSFGMTATRNVLEDIARGEGPVKALLALGYSGWSAGQLEGEIAQNGWLTADASGDLVFNTPDARKWEAALATLGIDPLSLSATAGRA
jgi:putative transcriptional regulator